MNNFQVIQPSVLLAPYVKQYWFLTKDNVEKSFQRLVPFGCLSLGFHRGYCTYSSVDNDYLPQFHLYGISKISTDITFEGNLDFVCIVFQPEGAGLFFDIPLNKFTNKCLAIDTLGDRKLCELAKQLNDITDNLKCVHLIEQFLVRRIYRADGYDVKRIETVMHSIRKGETDISELAQTACVGYKQFKRIFSERVGINPKIFLQINRFQRLHRLLQQHSEMSVSQLACECNYYDKSHLLKDLKTLSGFTPIELREACNNVYSDYHSLFRSAFVDLPYIKEVLSD